MNNISSKYKRLKLALEDFDIPGYMMPLEKDIIEIDDENSIHGDYTVLLEDNTVVIRKMGSVDYLDDNRFCEEKECKIYYFESKIGINEIQNDFVLEKLNDNYLYRKDYDKNPVKYIIEKNYCNGVLDDMTEQEIYNHREGFKPRHIFKFYDREIDKESAFNEHVLKLHHHTYYKYINEDKRSYYGFRRYFFDYYDNEGNKYSDEDYKLLRRKHILKDAKDIS